MTHGRSTPRSGRTVAVLAVACLVVLGGCTGTLGGDGGGNGDDAAPSTSPPRPTDGTYPPGVNENGIVDADALLSAHRSEMVRSGFVFTFEHRQVDEYSNGSTVVQIDASGEVRAEPVLAGFRERVERSVPVEETTGRWTNATGGYERTVADVTTYDRLYSNASRRDTTHYQMGRMLDQGEWRVVDVTHDGEWVVMESEVDGQGVANDVVEGRLVVDGDGRIRRLNATSLNSEHDADVEGRVNHSRTVVYEVTTVDNVTVTPPDWVSEARNASGLVRAPLRVESPAAIHPARSRGG